MKRGFAGAGSELELGDMRRGARAYLAVAGGIDVADVLGSRSTDINAALGPFNGRGLVAGLAPLAILQLPMGTLPTFLLFGSCAVLAYLPAALLTGALPRDDFDQPFGLQMPQHLAHDGTAHAEFVAQRAFDEPRAWPEIPLHDCAAQLVQRKFAQRLGIAVDSEV